MSDIPYWLAVSKIDKIGANNFKKLYTYFSSMKIAWQADIKEWKKAGLRDDIVSDFYFKKTQINPEKLFEELNKEKIKVVTIKNSDYPILLKEIYNPPPLFYYKGALPKKDKFCLAVVGSRKIFQYGKQITTDIVRDLVKNKITIISGLALGVDTLAHQTTLDNGGTTVAVLGTGIDRDSLYPSVNQYLADKILDSGGALVSEYPPKTAPTRFNFPARNRIISGLSLGTLITEAGEKSGSLITAQFALDQNREIFAVPGNVYSDNSQGTNNLLKKGAKLTTCAQDILETLNLKQIDNFVANQKISPDTKEEETLLNLLSKDPVHIDFIVKQSTLQTSIVGATLTIMEMKGKVKNLGNMSYVLAR